MNNDFEYMDKARSAVMALMLIVIAAFAAQFAFIVDGQTALFGMCVLFAGLISNAILLLIVTWDKYTVEATA